MSASRTKKERQAKAAAGLSQREQQELAAAKKSKRNKVIYTVVGIIAVIVVAALLIWDSGVIQKHTTAITIGNNSYGVVDLDYYYYSAYSSYSSYASLYGLDTSTDLKEQELYEGYTWDQMLKDTAVSSLTNNSMLAQEAAAAGYELSADGQAAVDSAVSTVSTYASLYGVTESYFLQSNYGKYMTASDFKRICTEAQLAQEYSTYKLDSFEVTDEEIEDYYNENTATLDTLDYSCYLVNFDRTETDEEGNSVDLDEDTLEANRAEAEAQAQEILDALKAGDADAAAALVETYGAVDYSNKSAVSYYSFYDWLNDNSHGAGSSDIIENVSSTTEEVTGYYAIYVNDRYLDEYYGVDIQVIRLAGTADDDGNYDMDALEEEINAVLATYESGEQTAVTFGALADSESADASTYPGGLRENVSKSIYNDEINEWLFSDSREAGDYEVFLDEDSHNAYLIYYVGQQDTLYWRYVSDSNIRAQEYSDWQTEALENYTSKEGLGMHFVG